MAGKVVIKMTFEKRYKECEGVACRIWWKSFQPKGTKSVKSPEAEPAVEENDHGNELSRVSTKGSKNRFGSIIDQIIVFGLCSERFGRP